MLSKKIFISKLVPPQKLPSWAQAAPRARDRGPSTPRYPTPPQDPLPGPTPSSAIPGTHSPPAPGQRHQWVPMPEVKLPRRSRSRGSSSPLADLAVGAWR